MLLKNTALIFVTFFCLISHALTIVSDLDDTIKITRVKTFDSIGNALFHTDTFMGMPELLNSLQNQPENKLFVVSGSPPFLKSQVNRLFHKNRMAPNGLFLTNGTSYKPRFLLPLLERSQDGAILLGDDQESDPEFYENLKNQFPEKVKAIYIHQVNEDKNVILPEGQIGYLTAYEVAVHEATAGRLSDEQLQEIANSMYWKLMNSSVNRKKSFLLIPSWQKCSAQSVERILAPTRALPKANLFFLKLIEDIALQNCKN